MHHPNISCLFIFSGVSWQKDCGIVSGENRTLSASKKLSWMQIRSGSCVALTIHDKCYGQCAHQVLNWRHRAEGDSSPLKKNKQTKTLVRKIVLLWLKHANIWSVQHNMWLEKINRYCLILCKKSRMCSFDSIFSLFLRDRLFRIFDINMQGRLCCRFDLFIICFVFPKMN